MLRSKNILSIIKVTDEHVHDRKALSELVENIVKSDSVTIGKLFGDDSVCEGNEALDICQIMESCHVLM